MAMVDFLVVDVEPFVSLIGLNDLERQQALLDLGGQLVDLIVSNEAVWVGLLLKTNNYGDEDKQYEDKDFTIEWSPLWTSCGSVSDDEGSLLVILIKNEEKSDQSEQSLSKYREW